MKARLKRKTLMVLGFSLLFLFAAWALSAKRPTVASFLIQKNFLVPLAGYLNPNDPNVTFAVGNYYFGGGAYDIQKARDYFLLTIEQDATLPGAHYQLSR